jgi:hypothetical protein
MKKTLFYNCIAILILFIECISPSKTTPPISPQQIAYEEAFNRWKSHALHNYSIRQRCYINGPFDIVDTLAITVIADTIASIYYPSGIPLLDTNLRSAYKSIYGLFERISSLIKTIDTTQFRVDVSYDSIYGYPTLLNYHSLPPVGPTDSFYWYVTYDLTPGIVPQNHPYINALQQNTVWNIAKYADYSPNPIDSFKLIAQGDSVLSGRKYVVVSGTIDTNLLTLFLRDSSGLLYRYIDSGEVLESNMKLVTGDTFKGMQVYSVDSILNSGIFRKRVQFGWCNRVDWIEGICPFIRMLSLNDTCIMSQDSSCICTLGGSPRYLISSIIINAQLVYKK